MIKEGIHLNSVYQHWKGGYYKVLDVVYNHEDQETKLVIYHKCDINGVYISIRPDDIIVKQPFYRVLEDFVEEVNVLSDCGAEIKTPRFKFIKEL
jgi:hypothetical protein